MSDSERLEKLLNLRRDYVEELSLIEASSEDFDGDRWLWLREKLRITDSHIREVHRWGAHPVRGGRG